MLVKVDLLHFEEHDNNMSISLCIDNIFNSRTHEGYDQSWIIKTRDGKNFNPRTHEGYDGVTVPPVLLTTISIHVPMKGTTNSS